MENKISENIVTINCLPDEIIATILQNNNVYEILSFASTCKRFHILLNSNQYIWKNKFMDVVPPDIFKIIEEEQNVDWLYSIREFYRLKQKLYSELIAMSPKYYWENSEISLEYVQEFFDVALTSNFSYYYTIYILQDFVKQGYKVIDKLEEKRPYTLTEMHYAKVVLRHLIHTFLAVKWVRAHSKNELQPEIVVNFFLQWIDTTHLYSDENIDNAVQKMVKNVELILSYKKSGSKAHVTSRDILAAVSEVIYRQNRIVVTTAADLDTINIEKVINVKFGNIIAVAAVYQAVASRCGVQCDLIAFPNHLFLEWRDNELQAYTINLETGELHARRRCPFSQGGPVSNYKYCPDSLLQYIYSSFHMNMGAIKNWNTDNALLLLDFLGANQNERNSYKNFLPYLLNHTQLAEVNTKLGLKYLGNLHREILRTISNFKSNVKSSHRSVIVKEHDSCVKFAVGMICYHKKYDYVCIIRAWDSICAVDWQSRMAIDTLEFGARQPFYNVIATDQSERYVAQENLIEMAHPTRLFHLEDMIAREFTHFDGFAYMPNDQKRVEYPGDIYITNMFRNRANVIT